MNAPLRALRTLSRSVGHALALGAALASCLATGGRATGELESRFATVHNAFAALGLSEVGALHQRLLGDGQEARIDLDLAAGCTTVVAVGGASIVDLEAGLLDAAGTRVARASEHTSEATMRACVDAAGTYTLRLKALHGAGGVLVSTWSGAAPTESAAVADRVADSNRKLGTCDAPVALSAGDFSGSTAHAEHQNESKGCSSTAAAEVVYRLDLTARQKVTLAVETSRFDSVLYIRKGDCSDADSEVACNDDAGDQRHSKIEQVLEPGAYFVFVDGYSGTGGSFKLHVELADVPPVAELCGKAPLLAEGTPIDASTDGTFDQAEGACGSGAHGPDAAYALNIPRRERVRVVEHSEDFAPVVHLRSRCEDPQSEAGCADSGATDHDAAFLGILDPGAYAVFADSSQREASGKYTLTVETSSEVGAGVKGERCRDAIPLSRSELSVTGDTFAARDDVAGQCGGTGAPDVVYRLDAPARTHFSAHFTKEEGAHVFVLLRGCGAPTGEIECGKSVDRLLAPGTYFLAVDGESPEGFGAFAFDWSARDTQAQDAACKSPPALREGQSVSGTTLAGAVDKFTPSCAAGDAAGGAPDAVYQLVVPARRHVHLRLRTTGWEGGVLWLRKSCVERDTEDVSASEVECHTDEAEPEVDVVLDAGRYYVIVDGKEPGAAGPFTLLYETVH
jgi:hypothetical protein